MRWYVEVTEVGGSGEPQHFCFEAKQWQGALSEVRKLRGDAVPLSRFSIEKVSGGYRALEPKSKLRYVVTEAPGDAVLSQNGAPVAAPTPSTTSPSGAAPASSPALASPPGGAGSPPGLDAQVPVASSPAPLPSTAAPDTVVAPPPSEVRPSEPAPRLPSEAPPSLRQPPVAGRAAPSEPPSVRPTQPSLGAVEVPSFEVLRRRTEEPGADAPIFYLEVAYSVPEGTSVEAAKVLLYARFREVAREIEGRPPGKFVQLAVFDHRFERRPLRAPLCTLAWKDWRGEPVLSVPSSDDVPASTVPPPPPSMPDVRVEVDEAPPSSETLRALEEEASEGAPRREKRTRRAKQGKRRAEHEDIIGDLFERMHDLHFQRDMVAGAEFVLDVVARVLPCEGALLHVFDMNKREFVVVRAGGEAGDDVLLYRTPDRFPLFREVMRRHRALHVKDAGSHEGFGGAERWKRAGVAPRDALIAPILQGGRWIGLLELANPPGDPFHANEANAVDYLCEQLAEFFASRPLVLEKDVILPDA